MGGHPHHLGKSSIQLLPTNHCHNSEANICLNICFNFHLFFVVFVCCPCVASITLCFRIPAKVTLVTTSARLKTSGAMTTPPSTWTRTPPTTTTTRFNNHKFDFKITSPSLSFVMIFLFILTTTKQLKQ